MWCAAAALAVVLVVIGVFDPAAYKRIASWKFWVAAAAVALLAGTLLSRPTGRIGPVPYSLAGLSAATLLLLRAATLFSVAVVTSRHLSHRTVARLASRLRARRLGGALGLAMNVTPILVDEAREARGLLKLRRGGRGAGRLRRVEMLVVTLLVRGARLARRAAFLETLANEGDGAVVHDGEAGCQ
jgi:hypothetical protein